MVKKIANTNLTVILLALAGLTVYNLLAKAGNLEPSEPPGPTMKTLDEIYEAVSAAPPQKEPFVESFVVNNFNRTKKIVDVPAGKRFVLRKIYMSSYDWFIGECSGGCTQPEYINSLFEGVMFSGMSSEVQQVHDFPDKLVVFEGGQTLWLAVSEIYGPSAKLLLIGYVCDAQ